MSLCYVQLRRYPEREYCKEEIEYPACRELCVDHYNLSFTAGERFVKVGKMAHSAFRGLLAQQEGYWIVAMTSAFGDGVMTQSVRQERQ